MDEIESALRRSTSSKVVKKGASAIEKSKKKKESMKSPKSSIQKNTVSMVIAE